MGVPPRNTFGATAFSSYGAFWFGLGLWVLFVANPAVSGIAKAPLTAAATVTALNHDLGWITLVWAIFTIYMLIFTSQVNLTIFLVFLFLEVTFIILCIGNFDAGHALVPTGIIKIGGYLGLVTALAAWYASAAGVAAGMGGRSAPRRQAAGQLAQIGSVPGTGPMRSGPRFLFSGSSPRPLRRRIALGGG